MRSLLCTGAPCIHAVGSAHKMQPSCRRCGRPASASAAAWPSARAAMCTQSGEAGGHFMDVFVRRRSTRHAPCLALSVCSHYQPGGNYFLCAPGPDGEQDCNSFVKNVFTVSRGIDGDGMPCSTAALHMALAERLQFHLLPAAVQPRRRARMQPATLAAPSAPATPARLATEDGKRFPMPMAG